MAGTAADAGRDADVVVTMLRDADAVDAALFDYERSANALASGAVPLEMSTISHVRPTCSPHSGRFALISEQAVALLSRSAIGGFVERVRGRFGADPVRTLGLGLAEKDLALAVAAGADPVGIAGAAHKNFADAVTSGLSGHDISAVVADIRAFDARARAAATAGRSSRLRHAEQPAGAAHLDPLPGQRHRSPGRASFGRVLIEEDLIDFPRDRQLGLELPGPSLRRRARSPGRAEPVELHAGVR